MIHYINGVFHSLEDETKSYQEMYTDQGVIVGFDDYKPSQIDQTIDLAGAHVYPGFVDSHLHLMGYGQQQLRPSLAFLNEEAMIHVIHENQEAIIFEGYIPNTIMKKSLDKHFNDRFIVLRHRDYHAVTVNQKVLDLFHYDAIDGICNETDASDILAYFEHTLKDNLKTMFQKALHQLYRFGVTGGHSDDLAYFKAGFQGTLEAFNDVLKEMPFRTHLLMHHHILDDYLASNYTFLDQHPYLQLGAIKIFYDGTFGSKTALVSGIYDNQQHGIRIFETKTLTKLVKKVRKHGLPLAIHVIGDQGLAEVIDLLSKFPVKVGLHDRIIHASLWQKETLDKAKQIAAIFDVQPQFLTSDLKTIKQVYQGDLTYLYPWKTLLGNQLIICGSSDAPVEIPNPLYGMYDAIYREVDDFVFNDKECLSRFEALKLYTTYANIPTYKKHRGLLKKGYIADFTVLQYDVLTIDKMRFKDNPVMMTIIDEKIVYHKQM